jgi:AraC-like DNA-binding protein
MSDVTVTFALPDVRLRPYISTYYLLDVAGGPVEDWLHPEWANIRITLGGKWAFGKDPDSVREVSDRAVIVGPTSRSHFIRGPENRIFGIGVLPTGWQRLFRADAHRFANAIGPLGALTGDADADALASALIEAPDAASRTAVADAWLLARLDRNAPNALDAQVEALHAVLTDPASATVEQITATLGLPQARLARLSKRGFGFPPKLLLRRQRFLRMLGTLHARPYDQWPDFIDPQYVDQSHMIRDFQYFLGMSPSQYFALPRPILSAAAKGRAAFMGQPLQGLHLPRKGTD